MNFVFGPVPSRRLGQSLGIDPIPLKTCNWNCVYCQLGRSRPLVHERKDYFPPREILRQIEAAIASHKTGEIDWITFVGSGETTLHASLGIMIREVKTFTDVPVAVITNGSLFYLPSVREELAAADAVLPTLDAGTARLYRKMNRPFPKLTFTRLVEGLVAFRQGYRGKLWVEVMLVKDLNDSVESLNELAAVLERVQPDEVHIVQPTRPPAETWVQPPDKEGLTRARIFLGSVARVVESSGGIFDLGNSDNLAEVILGIITRHPMKESELLEALRRNLVADPIGLLWELERNGKAQVVTRYGIRFWCASGVYFPKAEGNQHLF